MKLKTRIIYISCLTVLIASFISETFIWMITGRNLQKEALSNGYQESFVFVDKLEQELSEKNISKKDITVLNYIFKEFDDNYTVAYVLKNGNWYPENNAPDKSEVEEVYNNTVFSYTDFAQISYKSYQKDNDLKYDYESDISYAIMNYEGRSYAVFMTLADQDILLFRLYDITDVQEEKINLAAIMAGITIVVTGIAILILMVVLKREFAPLSQLNEEAKNIAAGFHDKRIEIKKKDEIGQLSQNFNQMAEAVEQRTKSLEESEQKKTIFMGNLTHELKTPMTAISGYAQTLLSAKLSEEEQREALMYIYEECGRLERLSKKMMKLLELSENPEINFTDTLVADIFQAAEKSCQVLLKKKDISLKCMESGQHFYMDSDLMTDVLINLIDNAVKASKPGAEIILYAHDNMIEVQDFGKGIPQEELEKILEPFYMIDKSRSRKNGGAGLGLALIAVIVEKHHIKMSIDSEVGKGTRFILEW